MADFEHNIVKDVHFAVDIETLGTRRGSVITSIGVVPFNISTHSLADSVDFYKVNIDVEDSKGFGLTVDVDTCLWWLAQSPEAIASWQEHAMPLKDALAGLSRYIERQSDGVPYLWGNGNTFDNMMLRDAYAAAGMEYPVHWRNDLDLRTLRTAVHSLGVHVMTVDRRGVAHNSLDDAAHQAQEICNLFAALDRACGPGRG